MSRRSRQSWLSLSLLVGLTLAAVFAVGGVLLEIVRTGLRSEEQSHVLLAPLVAMALFWVRRERLRYCRPRWSLLGPLAIGAGWAMATMGYASGVDIAWHAGALTVVGGAVLTVVGPEVMWRFGAVVASMAFFIPIPGRVNRALAIPLQQATAQAGEWILDLFGVVVERSGSVLTINGVDVAIAEACNGMRMVSALTLVVFAFVFAVPMRQPVRLLFLIGTPLLALAVNVLRMIPTVLAYGHADIDSADLVHDLSGWVGLLVALGLLWLLMELLRWLDIPVTRIAVAEG